jgi:hypothetical protein
VVKATAAKKMGVHVRRVLMASVLLALSVSSLSLAIAGTAAAATKPLVGSVTCSKFKGSLTGTSGKIGKCTDRANTGVKGTFPVTTLVEGSGTITWNGTGTTTLDDVTMTPFLGTSTCASGDTELTVAGDVNGGTGAAVNSIPSGDSVSTLVCFTSSLTFSLAPGSAVDFIPES